MYGASAFLTVISWEIPECAKAAWKNLALLFQYSGVVEIPGSLATSPRSYVN